MQDRHLRSSDIDLLLDDSAGFSGAPLGAHLDACADCRARLAAARSVADALERLPHLAPHTAFADRVMTKVQVIEPWHVAAVETVRGAIPRSRPLRALALLGACAASTIISASALWIAFSANLTVDSASVITGRVRGELLATLSGVVETAFGTGAAALRRADGLTAAAIAVLALAAAIAAAAFGFRSLAAASRRRGE